MSSVRPITLCPGRPRNNCDPEEDSTLDLQIEGCCSIRLTTGRRVLLAPYTHASRLTRAESFASSSDARQGRARDGVAAVDTQGSTAMSCAKNAGDAHSHRAAARGAEG